MLSEHNRRRRERYAMDRTAHAAEQRNYRDRAKARRAAEALAQVRGGGGGEEEDEEEAPVAAAPVAAVLPQQHVSQRPQRNKPRAVWGSSPGAGKDGASEAEIDAYIQQRDVEMRDAAAAYQHGAVRSALTGALGKAGPAVPYGWTAPAAPPPPPAAGDSQLARLWAELVSQSTAGQGGAAAAQHLAQQQAYNAAAVAAFAQQQVQHVQLQQQQQQRQAGALPFDADAFAAALQTTAMSQPQLRDAAAAAATLPPHNSLPEALAALLDRLQPPPAAAPPLPAPQLPPAVWQQLSGNPAVASLLAQVLLSAPAAPPPPPAQQQAAGGGGAAAPTQLLSLTQTRFPSGASAHVGGGGGDGDAEPAPPPPPQAGGSQLPESLVLCREHSSARSGGSRWERALAAAASAQRAVDGQAQQPHPRVPDSPLYKPARKAAAAATASMPASPDGFGDGEGTRTMAVDDASVSTASLPDLTHTAVAGGGKGAAAEELRSRLRRAVEEARSASGGPASTTTSSGVLARLVQQRGAAMSA